MRPERTMFPMSRSNNDKQRLPNAGKVAMVPDEPFEFSHAEGEDLELDSAIGQAVGAASVCWTIAPIGIFMSQRAEQILLALKREIDRAVSDAYSEGYAEGYAKDR